MEGLGFKSVSLAGEGLKERRTEVREERKTASVCQFWNNWQGGV
jgi:hypothetical protein